VRLGNLKFGPLRRRFLHERDLRQARHQAGRTHVRQGAGNHAGDCRRLKSTSPPWRPTAPSPAVPMGCRSSSSPACRGGARLVAQAESGIRTLKDLKGKRVGRHPPADAGTAADVRTGEPASPGPTSRARMSRSSTLPSPTSTRRWPQSRSMPCAVGSRSPRRPSTRSSAVELLKPYDTPLGEPYRVLVMSEKMYNEKRDVALRTMKCFVDGHRRLHQGPGTGRKVRAASRCSRTRSRLRISGMQWTTPRTPTRFPSLTWTWRLR